MRLTIATAFFALSAAPAFAQSPPPTTGPMPMQGKPPATAFSLPPDERFKAIDTDHDGKITKAEFKAVLNPEAQKSIERIWINRDTNTDGWLNQAELVANGGGRAGGRAPLQPPAPGAGGAAAAPAATPQGE